MGRSRLRKVAPGAAQRYAWEFSTKTCGFGEFSTHKHHHSKPSNYRINTTISRKNYRINATMYK